MFNTAPIRFKKFLGWLIIVQLILGLGWLLPATPALAQTSANASSIRQVTVDSTDNSVRVLSKNYSPRPVLPRSIEQVVVDPTDNSVWVFWHSYNPLTFVFSHFDAEGKELAVLQFPASIFLDSYNWLGIDLTPGAPHIYFYVQATTTISPDTERYIIELNLTTGTSSRLLDKNALQDCSLNRGSYNPVAKHLYLYCIPWSNATASLNYVMVIDPAGKVLKTLDKGIDPILAKSGMTKLYAAKYYFVAGNANPFYDIITLDILNEQPTNETPLVQKFSPSNQKLGFFGINSQTGKIYLQTHYQPFDSASVTTQYVFAKDHSKLSEVPIAIYDINLINETANQSYGYNWVDFKPTQAVRSLDNIAGPQLGRFDWEVKAVDKRGLLYATLDGSYAGWSLDEANKANPGLGLLVINPITLSVIRFITLRTPDSYYADKATRVGALPINFEGRFFTETGHTLSGKFQNYWEKNGGLARFGYPITEPFDEYNPQLSKTLTVQYFERNRLELHPENAGSPYEVLLGVLGLNFSAVTGPRQEGVFQSGETSPVADGLRFKETGHTVTGKFYAYWQANGGLAQHGLPLTEPTQEVNPIDGKKYTVQYFERSRLELHPENAGSPYEVLMGHFGVQLLRARGWTLPL